MVKVVGNIYSTKFKSRVNEQLVKIDQNFQNNAFLLDSRFLLLLRTDKAKKITI